MWQLPTVRQHQAKNRILCVIPTTSTEEWPPAQNQTNSELSSIPTDNQLIENLGNSETSLTPTDDLHLVHNPVNSKVSLAPTDDQQVVQNHKRCEMSNVSHEIKVPSRRPYPIQKTIERRAVYCPCCSASTNHDPIRTIHAAINNWHCNKCSRYEYSKKHYNTIMRIRTMKEFEWISCTHGQMPTTAIQGGRSRSGELMYIACALAPDEKLYLGLFLPSTGLCYIQWKDREIWTCLYKILCFKSKCLRTLQHIPSNTRKLDSTLKIMTLRNPLKFSNYMRSYVNKN